MKATTALLILAVMGLLAQLNGYDTLGASILNSVLPSEAGGSRNWGTLIVFGGGTLITIGYLILGKDLPYAGLAIFFLGMILAPIGLITDSTLGLPTTLKVIFTMIYASLMIQAAVGIFGGRA